MRRGLLSVTGTEQIGPYTLLRVESGDLESGVPGQFFMLEAPGRVLPRPMSLCLAAAGELAFLIDPIGPGTRALCALERGDELHVLGPLGNGFDLDVERPLLVGGGIGVAPLPFLSDGARLATGDPRLPQRLARRGGGARSQRRGLHRADVRHRAAPRRSGRRARLRPRADARRAPRARPRCAARLGGADGVRLRGLLRLRRRDRRRTEAALRRGPVLHGGTHGSPMSPLLLARGVTERTGAPAGQSPAPPATAVGATTAQSSSGAPCC